MNRLSEVTDMGTTTISIPEELADDLYAMKGRGESYADVIRRLMAAADAVDDEDEVSVEVASEPDETDDVAREADAELERLDSAAAAESEGASAEGLATLVKDVLPGSGAKLDERQAALTACIEFLREQGEATPAEFKRAVYDEQQLTGQYKSDDSWWKNCIYKALGALADRTAVTERPDETGNWRWTGGGEAA